jgi:hypothetical protein
MWGGRRYQELNMRADALPTSVFEEHSLFPPAGEPLGGNVHPSVRRSVWLSLADQTHLFWCQPVVSLLRITSDERSLQINFSLR